MTQAETVVIIPDADVLLEAMKTMERASPLPAPTSEERTARNVRFRLLLTMHDMAETGAVGQEVELRWVLRYAEESGHADRFRDYAMESIFEAWTAVTYRLEHGEWPEGDVALLGIETPAAAPE
jgi:hypothetical protein